MSTRIDALILSNQADVAAAMRTIDQNEMGAVFVVDSAGRLCGILTDGDIRRTLLKGYNLATSVQHVMQMDYVFLPITATPNEILKHLTDPIKIIPLVDGAGRPVDYACFHKHHRLPVMEPALDGKELTYVMECVMKNWISSQGAFVTRFEKDFARFLGVEEAVSVSNGTAALHLALTALGLGPGDEVIVPDLTFAASINAVLYTGATPVLVDVCPETWTIAPRAVEAAITPRTKVIMPVHLYGHPSDMDEILSLAARAGCFVVEDCAESLGSEYKGIRTGAVGHAGCFSFFANKVITTGEGGMVVFNDPNLARRARILRDHGMSPGRRYWHECVGFNYRLTNLQAAVGVAQLERVEKLLDSRDKVVAQYDELLMGVPGIEFSPRSPWGRHVPWLYCLLVSDDEISVSRDEIMDHLMRHGIESRPLFYPLHEMPPYQHFSAPGAIYPVTESLSRRGISLPSGYGLDLTDIRYICAVLTQCLSATLSMTVALGEG